MNRAYHGGVRIEEVGYADVAPFRSRAAKEHVSVSPSADTSWFAAIDRDTGAIVGVAGLLRSRSFHRLKGIWVEPGRRGLGIGDALTETCIQRAVDEAAPVFEAYTVAIAYWQRRGFVVSGHRPNGAARVRRRL